MNTFAATQSIGGGVGVVAVCAQCGAVARINGRTCVSCLLRTGLSAVAAVDDGGVRADSDEPRLTAEEECLDALLAQIEVRDHDWHFGNYQILEEIGRGGMGAIYRARQRHSKRIVALKRLLSYHGDSRETLERFRREAEAAASLDHPNILPIYEVGEEEGLPFFTMKYAAGGSLQQAATLLRDDPRECVRLIMKVTRAVSYAHGEGILHRDIKPGNILLDARGEPLVSDFGLAKWLDRSTDLTRTLTVFGTPGYIAPEQARASAAQLTPAADIYSLGAVLFDLLAGRPPFLGDHALSVIKQAEEKPAPKLRSLVRHADRDLETICAKCLEREPKLRYRSAGELAEDLQRWLEGRPIVARPITASAIAWRWAQRNPSLAAGLTTLVVLIVGATCMAVRASKLEESVVAAQTVRHSIVVDPVLIIEDGTADQALGAKLSKALAVELRRIGPATVQMARQTDTGALPAADASKSSYARAKLCSTVRRTNGNVRCAIRLVERTSEVTVLRQIVSARDLAEMPMIAAQQVARAIYSQLDADQLNQADTNDPARQNGRASEFLIAARNLLDRRTPVDLDRAEECVKQVLQLEPNSSTAYAYLSFVNAGRVSLASNRSFLGKAREAAERAIELNPDNPEAQRSAAAAAILGGRFNEALEHCYREVELNGLAKRSSSMIAQTYRELGRPDKALVWYTAGAVHDVQPGETAHALGDCWSYLGDDQRALAFYQRALALHPEQPDGWLGLCRTKLLEHDFMEANEICKRNREAHREHPYVKQMTALVAFFSRNYAEARPLYEQMLRSDPSGGGRFYGAVSYDSALARINLEEHNTGAEALLVQAREHELAWLRDNPANPEALYRLAAVEACGGDHVSAIENLRAAADAGWIDYRAARLDPRFDAVQNNPAFDAVLRRVENSVETMRRGITAN